MMDMEKIYAQSAVGGTDILPYDEDTYQIVDESLGGVIAYCHKDSAERIVAALKASNDQTTALASTLGPLIEALRACDPDATVLLDYYGELVNPGKPTYYRGFHNELALTPDGIKPVMVAELIEVLRDIHLFGFTRPGRETEAPATTGVWVAKHREPSGLHVVGIRAEDNTVVVLTEERG